MFPAIHDILIQTFGGYSFDNRPTKDNYIAIKIEHLGISYTVAVDEYSTMNDVWNQIDIDQLRKLKSELQGLPDRKISLKQQISDIEKRLLKRIK
jgi:hypothetical protein